MAGANVEQVPSPVPGPEELAASLTDLGGFFAWGAPTDGMAPLVQELQEPALPRRFDAVRAALGRAGGVPTEQVDPRMAVSAVQAGLVSRLWSVALGAACLHQWVPDLRATFLRCGTGARNPVPLATTDPARGCPVTTPDGAATAISALVLRGAVTEVTEACARVGATSRQVLRSNAASALVGAAGTLARSRPEVAGLADAIARTVLTDEHLATGGGYGDDGSFRRRGCCLYYRLPGHGLCPDCVLVGRARPGTAP